MIRTTLALMLALSSALLAEETAQKPKSETLSFSVNWPSGLSLGEGQLTSTFDGSQWSMGMHLDAAIPAFAVAESAKSKAGADLCSTELIRNGKRGKKTTAEKTTFNASALTAVRETTGGGGKGEMRTSACPRDALTYIQHLRRELAAGRLPQAQVVYFGAGYQTRVQYTGTTRLNGTEADRLTALIKGPASEYTVELFFARDAVRTPLQVSIPVAIGKFTVEFSR